MKRYVVFQHEAVDRYWCGLTAGKKYEVKTGKEGEPFVIDDAGRYRSVVLQNSLVKGWAKYVTNATMENK